MIDLLSARRRATASLTHLPRSQVVARALALLLPAAALAVVPLAGGRVPTLLWLLTVLLAAAAAAVPATLVSLGPPAVVLVSWARLAPDPLSGWVLVVGVALVVAHAATATGELGPATTDLGDHRGPVARASARRVLLVVGALPLAWIAARLADGAPTPSALWSTAALVALACAAVGGLALTDDEPAP